MGKHEKKYERRLVHSLEKEEWKVYKHQKRLKIKYNQRQCQPDIIARKHNCVYIFEVKDTQSITGIGKTFGQIIATKVAFEKIFDKKKRKEIFEYFGKKNPRIRFCVAFPYKTFKKSGKIVNRIHMHFRDVGVCYIKDKSNHALKPKDFEFKPKAKYFQFKKNRLQRIK